MDADFFLIQKIKNGDDDAIEKLIRKYYPVIFKYCSYHAPDRQNAEDLTQETFERFFGSLPRYQHRDKTVNYLYVIARNLCRDAHARKREILLEELPETGENPLKEIEEKLEIERALKKLPEEMREVIILYYFQNLKLKEISKILQIGLPLVKYRISKAKKFMRTYLGEEDEK